MDLSRRTFLKILAAGAAAATAPLAGSGVLRWLPFSRSRREVPALAATGEGAGTLVRLADVPARNGEATLAYAATSASPVVAATAAPRWVMVIDLARCDGCRECTRACSAMHFVPPGQEWIRVYELQDHEAGASYWFPRPCMQCDNPPCVKVCPVSATWKREDGIVIQDATRCIGCRFCLAACPYQARSFNWTEPPHTAEELAQPYSTDWAFPHKRGVSEKCIFCPGLVNQGKLPACVTACPMGAIYFGDQTEDAVTNSQGETVRFSQLIEENAGYRFQEELGTEPRVYYLPPKRRIYQAPPAESVPAPAGGGHR